MMIDEEQVKLLSDFDVTSPDFVSVIYVDQICAVCNDMWYWMMFQ